MVSVVGGEKLACILWVGISSALMNASAMDIAVRMHATGNLEHAKSAHCHSANSFGNTATSRDTSLSPHSASSAQNELTL